MCQGSESSNSSSSLVSSPKNQKDMVVRSPVGPNCLILQMESKIGMPLRWSIMDAEAEKDREVAEIFNKKLVDEVSRLGNIQVMSCVMVLKRLAGWEGSTFTTDLEKSQRIRHIDRPSRSSSFRQIRERYVWLLEAMSESFRLLYFVIHNVINWYQCCFREVSYIP